MTYSAEAKQAVERLIAEHAQKLRERGAIEFVGERDYVGYLRCEPDGRYSLEVFAWGVNHGKVYGETPEAVKDEAHRIHHEG